MNKGKIYFGKKMYLGTFFINTWMDLIGVTSIEKAHQTIQDNPFKALPQLIQAGVNSAVVIDGEGEEISFAEACFIVDEHGINNKDFTALISDLTSSLKIDAGEEKKPKPKGKKKAQ